MVEWNDVGEAREARFKTIFLFFRQTNEVHDMCEVCGMS